MQWFTDDLGDDARHAVVQMHDAGWAEKAIWMKARGTNGLFFSWLQPQPPRAKAVAARRVEGKRKAEAALALPTTASDCKGIVTPTPTPTPTSDCKGIVFRSEAELLRTGARQHAGYNNILVIFFH